MTDRLTPDDADQMRDFADKCRRVAATAGRIKASETGEAVPLMANVEYHAKALQSALLAAASHVDPEGDEDDDE